MANLKVSEQAYPSTRYTEAAAPATPAAGEVIVYAKSDGLLYQKDDAGTETQLANAGAGDVANDAIWDAAGDLAVGSGADTATKLTKGSDGDVLTMTAGAVGWAAPASGGGLARANVDFGVVASDTTLGANWAAVDTGTDCVLAAVTGDLIEVRIEARIGDTVNAQAYQDAYSIVSAAPVNSLGLGTAAPSGSSGVGVLPLVADPSVIRNVAATVFYVAQAGDLDGGNITVRWYARRSSSNRSLSGGSRICAINWGQ